MSLSYLIFQITLIFPHPYYLVLKAFDRCHKDSGDKTRFWKLCLRKDWAGWNVSDISGVCYTSVGHHSAPFTFLEVSRDILCFVLKSKICENSGQCEPGQCVGISWLTKQQGNSHGHSQALVPSGGALRALCYSFRLSIFTTFNQRSTNFKFPGQQKSRQSDVSAAQASPASLTRSQRWTKITTCTCIGITLGLKHNNSVLVGHF